MTYLTDWIRRPASPRLRRSREDLVAFLRAETSGGLLLVGATAVALLWANTAPGVYHNIWGFAAGFGPHWLRLDRMTLSAWMADGLLAIFFYVVGLELKRELVVGELADRRAAALPIAAALGGMITPALIYLAVARGAPGGGQGWAIPVATDIAFALGVLSLAGNRVPMSLRLVLLTLAVADDIGGILLIAVLFASDLALGWLAGAVVLLAVTAYLQRRRSCPPLLYWSLAVAGWVCVHASGIHATITGVALGLLVRSRRNRGEREAPVSRLEHRMVPVSVGLVVPVFALSTTGVSVLPSALRDVLTEPITQGVMVGLLVGKFIGVLAGAWLAVRLGVAKLPNGVRWRQFIPIGLLAGIGYTVSLLIAGLALPSGEQVERAATAILMASTTASVLALVVLRTPLGRPIREPRTAVPSRPPVVLPSDRLPAGDDAESMLVTTGEVGGDPGCERLDVGGVAGLFPNPVEQGVQHLRAAGIDDAAERG
jgi:NhaA family Na+:H+ antiporter